MERDRGEGGGGDRTRREMRNGPRWEDGGSRRQANVEMRKGCVCVCVFGAKIDAPVDDLSLPSHWNSSVQPERKDRRQKGREEKAKGRATR